jgi:hypothetical protein
MLICVLPAEFLRAKPAELVACTIGVVRLVEAVTVVKAPVVAVVAPIVTPFSALLQDVALPSVVKYLPALPV